MGLQLPPMQAAIGTAAGFALPVIVEGYVMPYLPLALTSSKIGRWGVRIGIVAGTGWAARKFLGTNIGNAVLIGGGAWLILQAIREFAPGSVPGLGAQPFLGQYLPRQRQRALGQYSQSMAAIGSSGNSGRSIRNVPDRLNPASRY